MGRAKFGNEDDRDRQDLHFHVAEFLGAILDANQVDHVISCEMTGSHYVSAENGYTVRAQMFFSLHWGETGFIRDCMRFKNCAPKIGTERSNLHILT